MKLVVKLITFAFQSIAAITVEFISLSETLFNIYNNQSIKKIISASAPIADQLIAMS